MVFDGSAGCHVPNGDVKRVAFEEYFGVVVEEDGFVSLEVVDAEGTVVAVRV